MAGRDTPRTPEVAVPPRLEVGFVSTDTRLRDFLATVFQLDCLPPLELPFGALYRLQSGVVVLKVLVPAERPEPARRPATYYGIEGLRFLTIRVDDVDGVVQRAAEGGARVVLSPHAPVPGVRMAMIEDTDGNLLEVSQRQA
jgi:catechol 2,3-dioxygenase-like lactoylglutathione lyase family enzyme